MDVRFLARTWIAGTNTLVITIPKNLKEYMKLRKNQIVEITINDGHNERYSSNLLKTDMTNEKKCEKQEV